MPRPPMDEIAASLRDTLPEARERVRSAVRDLADRGRIAGIELRRRVRRAERIGRDNAFLMAFAALGLGVLVGWLVARNRD